jgi:hypothetical protein
VQQIRTRLTYSNVMVTLLAFVVLGGGTAYAASHLGKNSVGTKQLKKEAVTAVKIKRGAITGAQIQLSSLGTVPSATNATHASSADSANTAANASHATTAESASPEVFAYVEEDGTVKASLSKGLSSANVTHPSKGTYCITVPAFVPRGGQVTPEFAGDAAQSATLNIEGSGFCKSPAAQVLTSQVASPTTGSSDMPFYVEFYR